MRIYLYTLTTYVLFENDTPTYLHALLITSEAKNKNKNNKNKPRNSQQYSRRNHV